MDSLPNPTRFESSEELFNFIFTESSRHVHGYNRKCTTSLEKLFTIVLPPKEAFICDICFDDIAPFSTAARDIFDFLDHSESDGRILMHPDINRGIELLPCGHLVCIDCLTLNATTKIEKAPIVFSNDSLSCPSVEHGECPTKLGQDILFTLFPPHICVQYLRNGEEALFDMIKNLNLD